MVMRNGASFKMQSVMNHPAPYILQVVSGSIDRSTTAWPAGGSLKAPLTLPFLTPPQPRLLPAVHRLPCLT